MIGQIHLSMWQYILLSTKYCYHNFHLFVPSKVNWVPIFFYLFTNLDFRNSCKLLKHLRERLSLCSDELVREELVNLVHLLDSPLFVQLVSLQDTLAKLKSLSLREHLAVNQFDIDAKTGELVLLSDTGDIRELSEVDEASSLELATGDNCDSLYGTIKNLARGRMVETVVLQKTDDSQSLGFSIIGQLGKKSSELEIFVKDIQPEGLAAK